MTFLEVLNFLNFAFFTIRLSVIDLREKRLPNQLMYSAIVFASVFAVSDIFLNGNVGDFRTRFLPGLGVTLFFFLIYAVYPKGIGMGDVKGILLLGISLSGLNGSVLLVSVIASFLLAGFIVLALRLFAVKAITEIPFGPFLFLPGLAIISAQLFIG